MSVPVSKALLRAHAVTQVPLSAERALVAHFVQIVSIATEFPQILHWKCARSRHIATIQPVQHAMYRRHTPSEQRSTGRRAHWRGAEKILYYHPLARHAVQMRSNGILVTGVAQAPAAQVVRQNEQNVGVCHTSPPLPKIGFPCSSRQQLYSARGTWKADFCSPPLSMIRGLPSRCSTAYHSPYSSSQK